MTAPSIPFNRPLPSGDELKYLAEAIAEGKLSGDGPFTMRCQDLITQQTGAHATLLTHSCTAALEMAAMLVDVMPGDEVIMPSYTFVSTANAVVLRGGIPVFVDIRPDTLNIDETLVEAAVTARTKAVFAVHYAGVPADMDSLKDITGRHGVHLVEDAAQAFGSGYKGRPAGSLGDSLRSASTKPRILFPARAGRSSSTIQLSWRELKFFARREPTAGVS